MPKHFCKILPDEFLELLENMHPFDSNTLKNSFSVWRRNSCEFHMFMAFLEAHKGEPQSMKFDNAKICQKLIPDKEPLVFIAHSKNGAKAAYVLRDQLEQKLRCGNFLSGDAWIAFSEAVTALRQHFRIPEERAEKFTEVCATHVRKLEREAISRCDHFILMLPPKVTETTQRLGEKIRKASPWLEVELRLAQGLASGKAPEEDESTGPDITFLPCTSLKPLLDQVKGKK